MTLRIDLYCRVVDNFGDAGVCWRLARQLLSEHNTCVRLVIDRPGYVTRLAEHGELAQGGIEVIDWSSPPADLPDVVIAAFQCRLPEHIEAAVPAHQLNARAQTAPPLLWINLDYLSAEAWINGVHGRPSIKASGATEWFFLPGFTPDSGGLIRERNFDHTPLTPVAGTPSSSIESRADLHPPPSLADTNLPDTNLPGTNAAALKVSLFCYSGQDVRGLVTELTELASQQSRPIELLVTAGCDLADIRQQLSWPNDTAVQTRGRLTLRMVPWLSQHAFDRLLALCDLNFVRGEDSWIRAIWAGKPFVWSPYRQDNDIHLIKMRAFLKHMEPMFAPPDFELLQGAMIGWAANQAYRMTPLLTQPGIKAAFQQFTETLSAQPDLSRRLMAFIADKRGRRV